MKTVASEWKKFRKCFTADASPTYLAEHKQTFYAGAQAFLSCIPYADKHSDHLGTLLRLMEEIRDKTQTHYRFHDVMPEILKEMKEDGRDIH